MLVQFRKNNEGFYSHELEGWLYVLDFYADVVLFGFEYESKEIKQNNTTINRDNDHYESWLSSLGANPDEVPEEIKGYSQNLIVLCCTTGDKIQIGEDGEILVLEVKDSTASVRLGNEAPKYINFAQEKEETKIKPALSC